MDSPNSTARPAVVIVHGAWHTPWHYSTLVTELQQRGLDVLCPQLPSQSDVLPLPENASYEYDVTLVRNTLDTLIDQGRTIVVVAHSYGGLVANAAVSEVLSNRSPSQTSHATNGNPGRIAHVVYISAFVIPVGTAIVTPFQGALPPFLEEQSDNKTCTMIDPATAFYNDVESTTLVNECLSRNVHCPKSVCEAVLPNAPYEAIHVGDLDATYLLGEQDVNLPAPFAETMAELLGPRRRMERLDAGHCPMTSQPVAVAEIVVDAWKASQARLKLRSAQTLDSEQGATAETEPPTAVIQS